MRVHIAQCLCGPARHAILASVAPPAVGADETLTGLRESVQALLAAGGLDARCGLCGAPASAWTYEVGLSKEFPDFETAIATIRLTETANRVTRQVVDDLRRDRN